jgi:predicted nucleotidyltransferase
MMSTFGLKSTDLECIAGILKRYPEIDQAIIFGSRAMNRERKGSDVDIAVKGKELGSIVPRLAGELNDESPLPYHFDIVDYDLIDNENLKDHIDRVGILIHPIE